jgi:hypothetical protein
MDPWQSVGTPLEYWFFRTSWPAGALLVDVIRRGNTDQTRVSYHHEGVSGVVRSPGACELTERKSTGEVGAVAWDLAFTRGSSAVAAPPAWFPTPGAVDLSLVSWPDVTSSGTVTIDGRRHDLTQRPGMACHYWGRRLPDRWLWLSANDFDRPGVAIELGLLRSRLWGLPVPLPPLGYAWVRDGRERYVATPLTGLIRRMPAGDGGLDLRVIAPGGGWSIRAGAPATTFADLGEGIVQSLRADCVLSGPRGRAISRGTATLELRRSGRRGLQPSHQP